eukprot:jgi/Chrzof1/1984/Cz10g28250.t1
MNGVGSSSSCPVPSLLSITQEAIACNIESFDSLFQLPEELALSIFERVLEKGKLTPRVLQTFRATQHEWVLDRIQALNIQDVPPLIPDNRNPWLGQKPGWY